MTEGKRPGGLTALAVVNFLGGGLGVINLLGLISIVAFRESIPDEEARKKLQEAYEMASPGTWIALIATGFVSALLIILSGIGYLKQKKFLGRGLGNAYALLGVVSSITLVAMLPPEAGGSFSLGTILGLIYPILTLILINTTFKEDFLY